MSDPSSSELLQPFNSRLVAATIRRGGPIMGDEAIEREVIETLGASANHEDVRTFLEATDDIVLRDAVSNRYEGGMARLVERIRERQQINESTERIDEGMENLMRILMEENE